MFFPGEEEDFDDPWGVPSEMYELYSAFSDQGNIVLMGCSIETPWGDMNAYHPELTVRQKICELFPGGPREHQFFDAMMMIFLSS